MILGKLLVAVVCAALTVFAIASRATDTVTPPVAPKEEDAGVILIQGNGHMVGLIFVSTLGRTVSVSIPECDTDCQQRAAKLIDAGKADAINVRVHCGTDT